MVGKIHGYSDTQNVITLLEKHVTSPCHSIPSMTLKHCTLHQATDKKQLAQNINLNYMRQQSSITQSRCRKSVVQVQLYVKKLLFHICIIHAQGSP